MTRRTSAHVWYRHNFFPIFSTYVQPVGLMDVKPIDSEGQLYFVYTHTYTYGNKFE
jgi:hypothetical protein